MAEKSPTRDKQTIPLMNLFMIPVFRIKTALPTKGELLPSSFVQDSICPAKVNASKHCGLLEPYASGIRLSVAGYITPLHGRTNKKRIQESE
jgi:hypothetical protein